MNKTSKTPKHRTAALKSVGPVYSRNRFYQLHQTAQADTAKTSTMSRGTPTNLTRIGNPINFRSLTP